MYNVVKTRPIEVNGDSYQIPEDWSDNAGMVFVDKYCRSFKDHFKELTVKEVFNRLVRFWFSSSFDRKAVVFADMWRQLASPNSPQYFNAGIYNSYKVTGEDIGLWYISTKGKARRNKSTFRRPQLHACFIQPVEDNLKGIYRLLETEGLLFSRGSGTGTNFSTIRGKGERLKGGGTSSGLISFLEGFDVMAGTIKSGGITRRAAKMVVVDIDHPDIVEFVEWKVNEEDKAKALSNAGYGDGWQSESYRTVSGQNSNNSVRVTNKFMDSIDDENESWKLTSLTDNSIVKHVSPKYLWYRICKAAWACADPGIQFSDTINAWNTTPNSGEIRASNPCSEHLRLDNSACNLASINLVGVSAISSDNENFANRLEHLSYRWTDVLNRSIDLAGYPSKAIAEGAYRYRDIGLGFCGLGALLIRLGMPYDSVCGRETASLIAAVINASAYKQSAMLAATDGSYPAFADNRDEHLQVLVKHQSGLSNTPVSDNALIDELHQRSTRLYREAIDLGYKHGFRNAQLTVIAPTGTIGITMDSETTGIEPLFAINTNKELAGGGSLQQQPPSIQYAISRFGYDVIDDPEHSIFQTAVGENALSPEAHVAMVAEVQRHVSGGISKTVNLPSSATIDDIDKIYRLAYNSGVKCISVYRDGSKSQPLTDNDCKTCGEDEVCPI